jgi:hypothetical protein
MLVIYFVGTAGSGKSTMVNSFYLWLQRLGKDAVTVNLDPGAEWLPYSPDVDVREWVSLGEVMSRYSLGPNGAQVMCADLLALRVHEIKEALEEAGGEYVLVDTPGQLELFAFREAGRAIVRTLEPQKSYLAFLFDPAVSRAPEGYASLLMLSASVSYRFALPFSSVLSKVDLLLEEEKERILGWSSDSERFLTDLEGSPSGLTRELSIEVFRALENLGVYRYLVPISSQELYGFEDLYAEVQNFYAGGDEP